MEFILNVIFFVTTPCLIIYNILKEIYSRCCKKSDNTSSWKPCEKDKNCYSSHDIQVNYTHLTFVTYLTTLQIMNNKIYSLNIAVRQI